MIVVTNRVFLRTTGAQFTTLGNLAQYWAKHHGESKTWTDWKDVVEQKANMPGVLGPRRVIPKPPPPLNAPLVLPNIMNAPRPKAAIGLRLPTSQPGVTVLNPETSSNTKEDFPALGVNEGSKTATRGRWNNTAGIDAVKRVTVTPVPKSSTQSLCSGSVIRALRSPAASANRPDYNPFPPLSADLGAKKSQRKHGSS
jgi:hypothetical protein